MIVYFFLAMILVDGEPQLKGGTFPVLASCEERLEYLHALFTVTKTSECQPIVLVDVPSTR